MRAESLRLLIQAGNPIIAMETPDEPRAAATVCEVAQQMGLPLSEWSVTEGLRPIPPEASKTLVEPGKIVAALRYVRESAYPAIYLFKDVSPHCKDPQVVRSIRDLYFSPASRLWTLSAAWRIYGPRPGFRSRSAAGHIAVGSAGLREEPLREGCGFGVANAADAHGPRRTVSEVHR
jgi:hypothetical protein